MNFEKLLSENLLRFGLMNAAPDVVNKLKSLAEQTSSALESAIIAKFGDRSMRHWRRYAICGCN